MHGECVPETAKRFETDSEPALAEGVLPLGGDESECHCDDVHQRNRRTIVGEEKLTAAWSPGPNCDAYFSGASVVGVLHNLYHTPKRLGIQLFGAEFGARQGIPQDPWSRSLQPRELGNRGRREVVLERVIDLGREPSSPELTCRLTPVFGKRRCRHRA